MVNGDLRINIAARGFINLVAYMQTVKHLHLSKCSSESFINWPYEA